MSDENDILGNGLDVMALANQAQDPTQQSAQRPAQPQPADVLPGMAVAQPMGMPTALPAVAAPQPDAPKNSFGAKVMAAAGQLGVKPNEPGSWAKSLVGGVQGVLADAHVAPGSSGALSGITQAAANHGARMQQQQQIADAQKQRAFEDDLRTKQDARAEMSAADQHVAINLQNNVQKQQLFRAAHDADTEVRKSAIASDSKDFNTLTTGPYPAPIIYRDIPASEIQAKLAEAKKNGSIDPGVHTAFATGERPDPSGEKDEAGFPKMITTFSIAGKIPDQTINKETADRLNRFHVTDKPLEVGQVIPGNRLAMLMTTATGAETAQNIYKSQATKNELDALSTEQQDRLVKLAPLVNKYNGASTDMLTRNELMLRDWKANPEMQKMYPNLRTDIVAISGGQENISKLQHQRTEERREQQELNIKNHREANAEAKESQQKGLGQSYAVQNKEFDTVRKPIETQLDSFSTLRSSLDAGSAAGDAVVAPALLKALVAGGGVRITQAEISNLTHGRSTVEDVEGVLQKMQSGKSITPEQRKQIYSLLGAVEAKAKNKQDILAGGQDELDQANDVDGQRKAVSNTRRRLAMVDAGQYNPSQNQNQQNQPQQNQNQSPSQKLPVGVPQGSVLMQVPGGQPHWIPQQNLNAARKAGATEVK